MTIRPTIVVDRPPLAGRTHRRSMGSVLGAITLGASMTACAGGGQLALTTGSIVPLGNSPSVDGTPVAVYERVARAALGCWFGPKGPLSRTHQFSAEVGAPSATSAAEIVIFEKDAAVGNPRSIRAYRIAMSSESEAATRVSVQNLKLPADLADAMSRDIVAWAADKSQCDAQVARPPAPEPEPGPPPRKKKPAKKKARV